MPTDPINATDQKIRIEPLDLTPRGIRKTRELMNVVWPLQTFFTDDYLDWQYNRNPTGQAFGFNAWLGDELIGHYASQPIRAKVLNHADRPGLMSLNSAIHPKHRRPRLFFRLVDRSFIEGANAGYAYYLGVCNQVVTHLYLKHWKVQLLGPLDARIGFGEPRYREPRIDYDFARLWNEDELRWRMEKPGNPYRLRRSSRNPTVLSPTSYPLIKAEFEIPQEYRAMPFSQWLQPAGFSPPRIWIGKDPNIDWSRTPRINLPVKYRPSPLNLLFQDFHDRDLRPNADRVRFHLIDFDAY